MPTKQQAGSSDRIDPDEARDLTEAMLERAEVFDANHFVRRGRGRPKSVAVREQISVRLDPDVLARLRAAGPGWQSRINTLLRLALEAADAIPARRMPVLAKR
jgi:uncharacterized protein (DUF4415 family)